MKPSITILFIFIFLSVKVEAQSKIEIEDLQSGLNFIQAWYEKKENEEIANLQAYKEKRWYNYIPNINVGYSALTNKPLVSLSLPDYIGYINRKKELRYKTLNVRLQYAEKLNNDTIAYKTAYRELELNIQIYNRQAELLKYDSLLLKIKQEENKKFQATTEDVVRFSQTYQEKCLNLERILASIFSKVDKLETYLHRPFLITIY